MNTSTQPLSWYVEKLERGEPFTSLLYGDGEFTVMSGQHQGQPYTAYREVVTPQLRDELNASLEVKDVIHATDLNLVNYEEYQGGDRVSFMAGCAKFRDVTHRDIDWYDGTCWEWAVRQGKFGPVLKALRKRDVVLVGNQRLFGLYPRILDWKLFAQAPDKDAAKDIDSLEKTVGDLSQYCPKGVFVVCTGLGAIPLIVRLRKRYPEATFLDLGSTFDFFVGVGNRGWHEELRINPLRSAEIMAMNLEGL